MCKMSPAWKYRLFPVCIYTAQVQMAAEKKKTLPEQRGTKNYEGVMWIQPKSRSFVFLTSKLEDKNTFGIFLRQRTKISGQLCDVLTSKWRWSRHLFKINDTAKCRYLHSGWHRYSTYDYFIRALKMIDATVIILSWPQATLSECYSIKHYWKLKSILMPYSINIALFFHHCFRLKLSKRYYLFPVGPVNSWFWRHYLLYGLIYISSHTIIHL